MQTSDQIALLALIVAILALLVAMLAIYKGNRNASVATLVTLYEASRQAFQRFLSEKTEDAKRYELCELMNLLEIAAAILNERSFAGVSKEIQREYLNEVLELLIGDKYARETIDNMLSAPTTFAHIRKFYSVKRSQPLSVVTPRQWFQL
ncbi:MAG: hypothetical protein ABSF28_20770 [Terracidiphilus sp.]